MHVIAVKKIARIFIKWSLTFRYFFDDVVHYFARTRNCLVDPPDTEENPENPELAITEEGRGGATDTMSSSLITVGGGDITCNKLQNT